MFPGRINSSPDRNWANSGANCAGRPARESRQLRRPPRQRRQMAGRTGRGRRCRDLALRRRFGGRKIQFCHFLEF